METLRVAAIALVGVVITAITGGVVAFVTSRKALYVNAVTVERSKWIEKLRSSLADYPSIAHAVFYEGNKAIRQDGVLNFSAEYYGLLRDLQKIKSLLKLQLNPNGTIDQNVILLVDRVYELARTVTFGPELDEAERLLVKHAQFLLKEEWEKVKLEAGATREQRKRAAKRARDYQAFAKGPGAIPSFRLTGGPETKTPLNPDGERR
jgi:hypothetical protein